MTASFSPATTSASLQWRAASGQIEEFLLENGQTVVVGSNSDADVQLPFPRVSGKHCIIWMNGGAVFVRDCYSNAGTLIGGGRISETTIEGDTDLQIGSCRLSIRLIGSRRSPGNHPALGNASLSARSRPVVSEPDTSDTLLDGPLMVIIDDLKSQVATLSRENSLLRERLETFSQLQDTTAVESDPFQEEMLELLRSEIADLQRQLDERPPTETSRESTSDCDEMTIDMERLADRLESLLQELGEKDQQLSLVTDLLASAEATTQAEQEERHHLEEWLGDVENRVTIREQEWTSQVDVMKKRIDDLTLERNRAQSNLLTKSDDVRMESIRQLNEELRAENSRLTSELEAANKELKQLRNTLAEVSEHDRQEAVRIAQERAELARLKHASEQARQDLEHRERKNQVPTESEGMRSAMNLPRDMSSHRGNAGETLAKRIGRLWRRLDSW